MWGGGSLRTYSRVAIALRATSSHCNSLHFTSSMRASLRLTIILLSMIRNFRNCVACSLSRSRRSLPNNTLLVSRSRPTSMAALWPNNTVFVSRSRPTSTNLGCAMASTILYLFLARDGRRRRHGENKKSICIAHTIVLIWLLSHLRVSFFPYL